MNLSLANVEIFRFVNNFNTHNFFQICKLKFPGKLKWLTHMRRSHDKKSGLRFCQKIKSSKILILSFPT